MRKLISILLCLMLVTALTATALAAPEAPQITLEPQSAHWPEYSVASYRVSASGTNLHATWYISFEGNTYNLSDNTNGIEPWEGYAGESYGGMQEDDNTFVYFFSGIGKELDGAEIWCALEDGHYEVISQRAMITVGADAMPPTVLSLPAALTVEQGDSAELRCVCQAPGGTQLSFLWYETATGRMQDLQAIGRGEETADYLFCDTQTVGTRYYVCGVQTSDGGMLYSNIIPVTVTEKAVAPALTQPAATEPAPTQAPVTEPAEPVQTTAPQQPVPETTAPKKDVSNDTTAPATEPATTQSAATEPAATQPAPTQSVPEQDGDGGIPWWVLVLVGVGGCGAGIVTAVILIKKNQKTST